METYKNKKKSKKSGRVAPEQDDQNKTLAELYAGLPTPEPTTPLLEGKVHVQSEPLGSFDSTAEENKGEAETGESGAAKKKRRRKKDAAAAAAVTRIEVKEEEEEKTMSKVSSKEKELARREEAKERRKKEREEKLRKEEEERLREAELEKQAEEAKIMKKEREKEKRLRKKEEGKILKGKHKEEARWLETKRNQYNVNGTETSSADKGRHSACKQDNNELTGTVENIEVKGNQARAEKVNEVNSIVADKKKAVEEGEVEEWDPKFWDYIAVNLSDTSGFADKEAKPEPELLAIMGKGIKRVASPASGEAGTRRTKAQEVDHYNKNGPSAKVAQKNRRKKCEMKPEAQTAERVILSKRGEEDNLRSPVCCIMGHVDTGKTKLLDCLRGTNVQEGEAGGITQQIGATYFPVANIRARTKELKADAKLLVPGLLVIDTPGHECFKNLRSRGAAFCDIAILVVDIMHGLEPQTIESLNLLTTKGTKFIIALNKVDRLYGWKTCRNAPIGIAMRQQSKSVKDEFETKLTQIITQFKEQGLNTDLYYRNKEMKETFSIVPTSAISGEGIPELLLLLVQWTQRSMAKDLMFNDKVKCTVLEVKMIEGLGTTMDVVLFNGVLHTGDQIVVCGQQEPILTTIRALLTPRAMMEFRVKSSYLRHKELKASQFIRISAQGLEGAIAGTSLYVVGPNDDVDGIKKESMKEAMEGMKSLLTKIDRSKEGVCVQASTLGSLEALLEYLNRPEVNIPVRDVSIGPIHKRDVMKASAMLARKKEFATILAFDVKVTPEAQELADDVGVKIFVADIIYHLPDMFKACFKNLEVEEETKEAVEEAVFPCVLGILCVYRKRDPIILKVLVLKGIAKVGTPICIPRKEEIIDIGQIAMMQFDKQVNEAKKGQEVTIKICGRSAEERQKMFGKDFKIDDELVSHITRNSIDILKADHRGDMSKEEWRLITKLKPIFNIQ